MHSHTTGISKEYIKISGEYEISLVLLSVIFICISSYTAICMSQRSNNDSFFNRYVWSVLASIAMGFGIWSLHYLGVLAFALPVKIEYNVLLTSLSIVPAMLASLLAFYFVSKKGTTLKRLIYCCILMGLGVCSMHFILIASMEVDAIYTYHFLGLTIAVLTSFISFLAFCGFHTILQHRIVRIFIGTITGIAISFTHYFAMMAMEFYVLKNTILSEEVIRVENRYSLAFKLTIILCILVGFLMFAIFADKYVEYRAKNYDPHTHLPNFNIFKKRLAKKYYRQVAVWHFNEWTNIVQQFGYVFGEAFIKQLASKFNELKSDAIDIYRVSQDQIVIATTSRSTSFETEMCGLAKSFEYPIQVHLEPLPISAICALAQAKDDGGDSKLYDQASAIFKKNPPYTRQVIVYDEKIHSSAFEEELEQNIGNALKQDELYLEYQPKIDSLANKIVGFETLLRWRHPQYGFISPAVFIPILEKTDKIQIVTDWIIEKVCQQIVVWQKQQFKFKHISINIPGNYVTSSNLVDVLDKSVKKYDILPQLLELEITETSFVNNVEEASYAVDVFRKKGYSVALDDFGTGVSSLSYLKKMNISTLKIDKSFIDDVPHSLKDASILRGIIAIGESLKLNIVIEGVETKEQVNFLHTYCQRPIIQGYYFAKPLNPNQVMSWHEQFMNKSFITLA